MSKWTILACPVWLSLSKKQKKTNGQYYFERIPLSQNLECRIICVFIHLLGWVYCSCHMGLDFWLGIQLLETYMTCRALNLEWLKVLDMCPCRKGKKIVNTWNIIWRSWSFEHNKYINWCCVNDELNINW